MMRKLQGVNTVCALQKSHPLHQNRQRPSNCVSKVCNKRLKQTDNNCKPSVTDSVNSVTPSVCANYNSQNRCKTLNFPVCTQCASQLHTATRLHTIAKVCTKRRGICAHRILNCAQIQQAWKPSVFAPCLQIRVGRFDSGPRLHFVQPLFNHSGFSFDLKLLHAHYCAGSAE